VLSRDGGKRDTIAEMNGATATDRSRHVAVGQLKDSREQAQRTFWAHVAKMGQWHVWRPRSSVSHGVQYLPVPSGLQLSCNPCGRAGTSLPLVPDLRKITVRAPKRRPPMSSLLS